MMQFELPLPKAYRSKEVLIFHGRDKQQLAERVEGDLLIKGIVLEGVICTLQLQIQKNFAVYTVQADGKMPTLNQLTSVAQRLLSLQWEVESFEKRFLLDPWLGKLISEQRGLRIAQTATVFEALTWAIMAQQINLAFAVQLRSAFIQLANMRHSSGLFAYPDAGAVAQLSIQTLKINRFSEAKAQAIVRVAQLVENGDLPLEEWLVTKPDVHLMTKTLLAIKGIGPWTVNYTLLRGYGFSDCELQGDSAVREALRRILYSTEKITIIQAEQMLSRYAPYRSLAIAHLWASLARTE